MIALLESLSLIRVALKVASLACALGGQSLYALAAYVAADLFDELQSWLIAQHDGESV